MLPICTACGKAHLPAGPVCPFCFADAIEWQRGERQAAAISTWTVVHKAWFPAFAAETPYNVIQVELDEGPRLTSNLIGGETPTIGQRVEVVFDDVDAELTLHRFRAVRRSGLIHRLRQARDADIEREQAARMVSRASFSGARRNRAVVTYIVRRSGSAERAGGRAADRHRHGAVEPSVRRVARKACAVEHRGPQIAFRVDTRRRPARRRCPFASTNTRRLPIVPLARS